jgi:hypothetical protein
MNGVEYTTFFCPWHTVDGPEIESAGRGSGLTVSAREDDLPFPHWALFPLTVTDPGCAEELKSTVMTGVALPFVITAPAGTVQI